VLKITNIPSGEKISDDFEISLNGISAKAYSARVSAMPFNRGWPGKQRPLWQTEEASFLTFAMDEPVNVELKALTEFNEVIVRPLSKKIKPETDGQNIRFTIEKPGQYTVELDGIHKALHIFANPVQKFNLSQEDENVIYFGPGIHNPGIIEVKSGQCVYIDQDAVVYGSIIALGANNVRVTGYGVLDGSNQKRDKSILIPMDYKRRNILSDKIHPALEGYPLNDVVLPVEGTSVFESRDQFRNFLDKWDAFCGCIHFYNCTNTEINGIVMRDSAGFTVIEANCVNAVCDNVKLIGMWRYNSDGIDIFNSQNCVIRNSFLRNFDDCIVLKGIPGWDRQNVENILIENCITWCDWGRNLEIGAETNAPEYKNIVFRNCDCIHCADVAIDIQHTDRADVHDVLFEDIRVEYSKHDVRPKLQESDDMVFEVEYGMAYLIFIGIEEGSYSNDNVKGNVSNVRLKNIQAFSESSELAPISVIGYSKEAAVKSVLIENLYFNGEKITDKSVMTTNEFTENIQII